MESIHLIGIAGSGMLPLAELALKRGMRATGSDRLVRDPGNLESLSPPIRLRLQRLMDLGAQIFPQDGSGVTRETVRAVYSTAIEKDNPDRLKAESFGVPLLHRSEELKNQIAGHRLLAVAGTSGKSTTTAMCAWLLQAIGELGCFVGGSDILDASDSMTGWSQVYVSQGQWACVELDESDKSLLRFAPETALILNIARDHHSLEENLDIFYEFSRNVQAILLLNESDSSCRALADRLGSDARIHWFAPPAPQAVFHLPDGVGFLFEGERFETPHIGRHNAANLLAALAAVRLTAPSASLRTLQEAAKTFPGIRRRLQRYGCGLVAVFDDYAHNPDKIAALLEALQLRYPRLHLVFQPHGYQPLRFHLDGFAQTLTAGLRPEDYLYLLPVYDAGGTTNRSISSKDLADKIPPPNVHLPASREEALNMLQQRVRSGDAVAVAGARDDALAEFAQRIAERFS
ncbi:MAG: Mur ligase domain-containing protein [Candidatus Omnitrophota bacterium]